MVQYLTDQRVLGYHAGNESAVESDADYILEDINQIELTRRATKYKDSGSISVNNTYGRYSGLLRSGDRLLFKTGNTEPEDGYGTGGYGTGPYGGTTVRRWTAVVRNYEIQGQGVDNYVLDIEAEDFAAGVMGMRQVYDTFEQQQIVGTDGILNEILREECPEIDRSRLPDLPDTTTIFLRGQYVLPTAANLASRANQLLVTDGKSVDLVDPNGVTPKFTVIRGSDVGTFKYSNNDDGLVNSLRTEGGTGHDIEEQSAQTTVNGYALVSETQPLTFQIPTRKSSLERIQLWTHPTSSGEDYKIRLQKDQDGAPIAINSNKSDIVSKSLAPAFVDDDGFTDFILPEHTLPEPFPWMIVQTDGSDGQEIGINTNISDPNDPGVPGVIPEYPYEIILSRNSPESIERYRRREDKISDDSIGTYAAANDLAQTTLAQRDEPNNSVELEAYTERMHALTTGDVVTLDHPEAEAVGDYVVLEIKDTYTLGKVETTLTLRDIDTI